MPSLPQNGTPGPDTLIGTWFQDSLFGLNGNDKLYGDRGDDILQGGAGNDLLWGGLGADQLDGGAGYDTAVYKASASGVTVNLATGTGSGGEAEGDTLAGIESLVGSDHADTLTGNALNNTFRGGAGADHIDGGVGHDRASYAYSSAGVDVDLTRTGPQIGGDAEGDVLVSIERLTGSSHADRLAGDAKDNHFSGGAGADLIDGRAGNDFVDYRGSTAIDIDLTRAVQHGGDAEGDQLTGIESIRGSTGNDRIIGDAGRNHLIGDAGNDYIDTGTAGATRIYDRVDAGSGDDTVVAHMNRNTFATLIGGSGVDTLILRYTERVPDSYMPQTPTTAYFGYTYATGFEHVEAYGSNVNDFLYGMSGTTDKIYGGDGNDTIRGGPGDYLDGGQGYDYVQVDLGDSSTADVTANLGAGTVTGMAGVVGFEDHSLVTGAGDDTIIGGSFRNYIYTNAGDDHITVYGTENHINTGTGNDTVIGSNNLDSVFMSERGYADGGGGTYDSLFVSFTSPQAIVFEVDENTGEGGANTGLTLLNFERYRINTGAFDDTIRTGNQDDVVYSGDGNDIIETRGGDDDLRGVGGNDTLDGGAGDDLLLGGTGTDRFYFSFGKDVATDFNAADGDILVIRQEFQGSNHGNFSELIAQAQETTEGLLITDSSTGASMLLRGLDKADINANAVEFA